MLQSEFRIAGKSILSAFLSVFFTIQFVLPVPSSAETTEGSESKPASESSADDFKRFEVVFEPRAYYTDLDFIIALTETPIPQLGEKTEAEIYTTLLSRSALLPRFLVLEASVNPMPCLGVYLKRNEPHFYENARISGSFNWIQALTAGFEEPYAFSILAGNVANFYVAGSQESKGLGYSGYLYSVGNYQIRDNSLIHDRWQELEWKLKGDRESTIKKLSWSFRIGAKLHDNPYITDTLYLSFRRSRTDYRQKKSSVFNNSGFEYTVDINRKTLTPLRHYFSVDKKWPFENKRAAFSLATGFIWESAGKYTGPLAATGEGTNVQFILRPNIEF